MAYQTRNKTPFVGLVEENAGDLGKSNPAQFLGRYQHAVQNGLAKAKPATCEVTNGLVDNGNLRSQESGETWNMQRVHVSPIVAY